MDNLEIFYQNSRGLKTKTEIFYSNVLKNNYDVIVLTETWLNSNIFTSELFDSRYTVHRKDRVISGSSKSDGGGVVIAVSNKIQSSRISNWETGLEDMWVSIDIIVNNIPKKLALCSIYLPPPSKLETLNAFLDNSTDVLDHYDDAIIIGDFN